MPKPVYRTMELLCEIVLPLPIGTNLALLHLLWMLLSGRLLAARGGVIPALRQSGLSIPAVRRAWAGLGYGRWTIQQLLDSWWAVVQREGRWHRPLHGGYRALPVDLTGFFRPRLQGCPTKHFWHVAGKALPAIPLGLIASVGQVGWFRLAVLRAIVRPDPQDPRDAHLRHRLLCAAWALCAPEDVVVADAEFKVGMLQAAHVARYLIRGAKNFTAQRAQPPPDTQDTQPKGQRKRGPKPKHGARVRPLARTFRGRVLPATPPDEVTQWSDGVDRGRAECWYDLVLPGAPRDAPTFHVFVLYDARYAQPLLLITPLRLAPSDARALYLDRWPVEQPPLVAKQLLGAHRQFVFAQEARQRLPELALFAGSLLSYLAATGEALATGFWDRTPRPTAGRLRRALGQVLFPQDFPLLTRIREKHAPTAHLPKGVEAHRRRSRWPDRVQRQSQPSPASRPIAAPA